MKFRTYITLALGLFLNISLFSQNQNNSPVAFAQSSSQKFFVNDGDIFGTKGFIENKGQYDGKVPGLEKVLFVFDRYPEKIYFTPQGLVYEEIKIDELSEREREEEEEGKKVNRKPDETYFIRMTWVGANYQNIEVVPSEKQNHYITYGGPEFNSHLYKIVTYKNVYPNIDIEYSVPENKAIGIKYSVILHPGADPNQIKILYSGDVKKVKVKSSGDVVVKTPHEDIMEHAPESYYSDKRPVNSIFKLSGDTIGFEFPEGRELDKTLIIDPWVSLITTLTTNNLGYDVDYDIGGNVFVFGGFGYCKVAMYNAAGVLQWTFSGNIVTPAWTSQIGISGTVGNFAVDRFLSKAYVGQGTNYPKIIRLNALGNYDNFMTPIDMLYQELWDMGFHCTSGEIFVLGGGHTSNMSSATINTLTASLVLSSFQPTNTPFVHDISTHTMDDAGNIFVYYACSNAGLNQKMIKVNPTFNGSVWLMPSGYNVLAEINNKNGYGAGSISSAGFNGLAANNTYLYYYDGGNLAVYSNATGAFIASTTTGLSLKAQGGIVVDNCNNIYVGGNGSILTYNFNGSSFSTLTPIPLATGTPTQRVCDIKINHNTKTLFVSGFGFVATYPAVYSYTCPNAIGICLNSMAGIAASSTSITCATLGTATVSTNGGLGPFSYTWIPSSQTGSTATGLSPGTYTIVVYDAGYNSTYSTTTTFLSAVPLTGIVNTSFMLACNGVNTATANITSLAGGSGSQTYLWTDGVTTQTTPVATGLGAGTHTVTVTDALTGCILTNTFMIYQPSVFGTFISATSPSACVGSSITLSGFSSGGVPAYTYTWTGPVVNHSLVVSHATPGNYTYTLTSKDANNCMTTSTIALDFVPYPVVTVANTSICPLQVGTLTAGGATTYTWSNTTTGNTFTDNPGATQQYTVIGSSLSCSTAATASIILKPVPVPVFSSNSPVCNGQSLTLSVSTATAALWTGPVGFTGLVINPAINPASPNNSGTYQVTVTALNSCTAATSGTVLVNLTPTLSALGSTVCVTQALTLNANSFPGATYQWKGPSAYVSSIQNPSWGSPLVSASGNYTVKATSVAGCTNTAIANVTVTPIPVVTFTSNSPKCYGSTLNFNTFATTTGLIFSWSGPNGFSSSAQNPNIPNVTIPASGNYNLLVTNGPCVVSITHPATIHPLPTPVTFNSGPACETKSVQLGVSNSGISYLWSGPGSFTNNQIGFSISNLNSGHSGNYIVTVTDANGCQANSTTSLTVLLNPIVNATGDMVCFGQPASLSAMGANTYFWMGPANFSSNASSPIVDPTLNTMVWTYTVVGTAVNGCTAVTTTTIGTRPLPIPSLTVTPRVCVKSEIQMQGQGGLLYHWKGPLDYKSDFQNPVLVALNSGFGGTYSLIVTDVFGCKGYTTSNVIVDPEPTGVLWGDKTEGCVPFCSSYSLQSIGTISIINSYWQLGAQTFTNPSFSYCFNQSGDFQIKGIFESERNCKANMTFHIRVFEKPEADFVFSPVQPIENEDQVIFTNTSKGAQQNKWHWAFINNQGYTADTKNTSYLFEEAGEYVVAMLVQNAWGCMDTILKPIEVVPDYHIFIPNTFTPNGDDLNETFFPVMRGVRTFNMQIFDRWGTMIFSSSDPKRSWDGALKGDPCQMDVYNYRIKILTIHGEEKNYIGKVTLLR